MSRENTVKITSDLTGDTAVYDAADVPKPVKLTMNGKSGERDLTADEVTALESFIVNGDASDLRKILAPAAVPAAAVARKPRSGGSKRGDERNAAIREWAGSPEGRKALGLAADADISTRGRLPASYAEAYDAAHTAQRKASAADAARASAEHNGLTGPAPADAAPADAAPADAGKGKSGKAAANAA